MTIIFVLSFGLLVGICLILIFSSSIPVYCVEYKGIEYYFLSKKRADKQYAFLCKVRELEQDIAETRIEIDKIKGTAW